jgi:hypothetical protein
MKRKLQKFKILKAEIKALKLNIEAEYRQNPTNT